MVTLAAADDSRGLPCSCYSACPAFLVWLYEGLHVAGIPER
jgi:hypothetical protein